MPETTLTKTVVQDPYQQSGTVVTMAAADTSENNRIVADRDVLVLAHNTGSTQRTITVTSVGMPVNGRTGDYSDTIEDGEIMAIRLTSLGWSSGGYIVLAANHAEVEFGVIAL